MTATEPHNALQTPRPTRPKFNSRLTSDRLREGSFIKTRSFISASTITKDRKSVFREIGLDDDDEDGGDAVSPSASIPSIPTPSIVVSSEQTGLTSKPWNSVNTRPSGMSVVDVSMKVPGPVRAPASALQLLHRFTLPLIVLILAAVVPGYSFLSAAARGTALDSSAATV